MRKLILLILLPIFYTNFVLAQTALPTDYAVKYDPTKQPMVLVDGIQNLDPQYLQNIDPNTICELKVLKGEEWKICANKYDGQAKIGVISVSTKKFVAKEYYIRFAEYNPILKEQITKTDFNYMDYRLYINGELLDNSALHDWKMKLQNQEITLVNFEAFRFGEAKGEIRIGSRSKKE